jgi:hypothetical protein
MRSWRSDVGHGERTHIRGLNDIVVEQHVDGVAPRSDVRRETNPRMGKWLPS